MLHYRKYQRKPTMLVETAIVIQGVVIQTRWVRVILVIMGVILRGQILEATQLNRYQFLKIIKRNVMFSLLFILIMTAQS